MGGPGTNEKETRSVFHCPQCDQIVVGVPSMDKAVEVAKEFADKVESIELCGYFGREERDVEVSKALGGKYRVGATKYVES